MINKNIPPPISTTGTKDCFCFKNCIKLTNNRAAKKHYTEHKTNNNIESNNSYNNVYPLSTFFTYVMKKILDKCRS